ncbi:hypothetical protein QQ020_01445 [Fulvivirgaceae bacterium BMA12]|uniref:HEAT repeat domain-containing protein n=1 Tax=Agaribacillus aureus TaxID=3051825 RepID=A0ABT8KYY5_9BACT|nr:hypothetical protein [Fulvivirgaceae bacterium BMA12]
MNLKKALLKDHSRAHALYLADYIRQDEDRFGELMQLFFDEPYLITQRAAWVVGICGEKHPSLIMPYLEKMILNLDNDIHDAVKRNSLRILQDMDLPDNLIGPAADICFRLLSARDEPVAVKVFSMTVLLNVVKKVPELKNELKIIIEDQMPYGSAGFVSRGRKTLQALSKI